MADQTIDPYAATAIKPVARKVPSAAAGGDPYAATATPASLPAVPIKSVPSPTPPQSGFLSSLAAPFVNTLHGLKSAVVEGPQNAQEAALVGADESNPAWQSPILGRAVLAAKRILVDPQVEQGREAKAEFRAADALTPWTSFSPSPAAQEHRQLAGGHALAAAIPFLGPWAASVGAKEGEQLGSGNLPGAAGTGIGNALLALLPKAAGKGVELAGRAPEAVARAVTDTGAGPVKELVAQVQDKNKVIEGVNADRLEKQRQDQAEADYDHRADLLKLKQKYDQIVRDLAEKARTGTAADRAKVASSNLAAKQEYDQSVRDAQQKYQTARAAAEQANADAQRKYAQSVGQRAQQNRAATAAEQASRANAARTQVGGSQLIYGLNQLDHALNRRADAMYTDIREKVGNATLPSTDLRAAADKAAGFIKGTTETPKVFRDIATKYSASEPEFIEYQGSKITPDNALYKFLRDRGVGESTPVTFADLQGYYSELGKELSRGTLPGDLYQATRALQDAVGGMMQKLADQKGVGQQLASARKFYRDYMDTFHEPTGPSASGSPVAQALLAKDPEVAASKFAGDSGDRGIALLRRYSPQLANLAQDVRGAAQAKVSVPARATTPLAAPSPKPVPSGANLPLPPVVEVAPAPRAANLPLPPVLPEPETVPVTLKPRQTISAPDLVVARRAAAEARAGKVQTRGTWVATWPVFQAMRALWGGHIPSLPTMALESAGTFATTRAATAMMRYPPMMEFLTKARPEDLALIPPDLRGDLPGLVNLARRQGVQVSPALVAATIGAGQPQPQQAQPLAAGATQ